MRRPSLPTVPKLGDMERRDAFTIVDEILTATGPGDVHRLRPPLTEALGMLKEPEHVHFDVPSTTIYLLDPNGLVVVTAQAKPSHGKRGDRRLAGWSDAPSNEEGTAREAAQQAAGKAKALAHGLAQGYGFKICGAEE
jgi:hypothetical protein